MLQRLPRGWLWVVLLALVLLRTGLSLQGPVVVAPGDPLHQLQGERSALVRLEGRLLGDPHPLGPKSCGALIQWPEGRSDLRFRRCPALQEGWWLAVQGELRRPLPAPHPLLAGTAERLAREGAFTQVRVDTYQVLSRPSTPLADLRRRLSLGLQRAAGPERGGVLAALVLGSAVVPLPSEVREAFRAAGLSHALAASGFHLSVLLGALRPLLRHFGAAGRLLGGFAAMAGFVLLAGPQPSVLRAVLMGAIALLVLEAGGRSRPLGVLALATALLLLLQPSWLLDVGFQLSVVATAALVVQAPPLERWLQARLPSGLAPWLPPALAVPIAASLWTLPLQMLHFGVVPLYAVPANLLAGPLLTPLTLAAMALALVAGLLPPLLLPLALPCGWLCGLLVALAKGVAALPMAQWQLGRPQPLLVLLLALALLGWGLEGLPPLVRRTAPALLALVVVLQLAALSTDQLLLVHQGRRDLLVARHQGRAALVSGRADALSCRMAAQLVTGLGLPGFDWAVLLDPLPPDLPGCWQQQSAVVLAAGDGSLPLRPGQRLQSPGLAIEPLDPISRGLQLRLGRHRWWLLPDPQALWAWREDRLAVTFAGPDGVWLGFQPGSADQRWLSRRLRRGALWLSGSWPHHLPRPHWQASGASGYLQRGLG